MDPAGQSRGLPDICRAQFIAMMRSFHFKFAAASRESAQSSKPFQPRSHEHSHGSNGTRMVKMFKMDFKTDMG
jgi:hypothetical protein